MDKLAALPLVALITGALLQVILGRRLTRPAQGWLAFGCGLAALGGTLALVPAIAAGQAIDATLFFWDRGIPLQYHVDGLSLVFSLMATGIGSAILLYCVRYMADEPEGTARF